MLPSSADVKSAELGPGAVLGKYRLTAKLGEGGMGVVFAAVHERLGRPVAIKVLLHGLSENTELASRFQMEAELVTRIGHPNIVAIYDFGRHTDGRLFYVMEIISGESLRGRMQRRPLADQEIVEIFGRLLSALRTAHDIGVVHRDLKPDNVMLELGSDGAVANVKLLDFGIAKIRDEQPGAVPLQVVLANKDALATAVGAIMGTPAYMAPEQIRNSSAVDKRADIYALGIMLYEALAGVRPFGGSSPAELLGAHLYQQAERPSVTAKKPAGLSRQVPWSKLPARAGETPLEMSENVDTQAEALIGITGGDYKIIDIIGKGGMGVVYTAEHTQLHHQTACKVLRAEMASHPETVERFLQEAKFISRIRHQNLIDIFDIGELPDKRLYHVMEKLSGRTLAEVLQTAKLPFASIVQIATQICAGLAAAHAAGLVHRDLKPDNLFLVERQGEAPLLKIMDFGVAAVRGAPSYGDSVTSSSSGTTAERLLTHPYQRP